ncbi:hypothetical protein AAMO2058_001639500, partial [Amorphochlora amoebiformis]
MALGAGTNMEISNITETGRELNNSGWLREFHFDSDGCKPIHVSILEGDLQDPDQLYKHSFRSSIILSALLHADPSAFIDASVLELGSSLGLSSLVASHFAHDITITENPTEGKTQSLEHYNQSLCAWKHHKLNVSDPSTYLDQRFDVIILSEGVHPPERIPFFEIGKYSRRLARAVRHHAQGKEKTSVFLVYSFEKMRFVSQ